LGPRATHLGRLARAAPLRRSPALVCAESHADVSVTVYRTPRQALVALREPAYTPTRTW